MAKKAKNVKIVNIKGKGKACRYTKGKKKGKLAKKSLCGLKKK